MCTALAAFSIMPTCPGSPCSIVLISSHRPAVRLVAGPLEHGRNCVAADENGRGTGSLAFLHSTWGKKGARRVPYESDVF